MEGAGRRITLASLATPDNILHQPTTPKACKLHVFKDLPFHTDSGCTIDPSGPGYSLLIQSVGPLLNPLASEGFHSMATDRVTVRIAEAAILRLEEVLTRSDRPLNPQTRATMVEEVLTLSARIFDQDDEILLTTRSDLETFRDEVVQVADVAAVTNARSSIQDLFDEQVTVERSLDGRYFTVARADGSTGNGRTHRVPSTRDAVAGVSLPRGL